MTRSWLYASSAALALLIAQAWVLFAMGQPLYCTCGYIKLWEGVVLSIGNSQHITDWYTYSHVIHGILFYGLFWRLFPNSSVPARLLMSLGLEVGWEVLENTPWVIDHYRKQALAVGYVGDSVLNSVCDSVAMLVGFAIAWRAPLWATVGLGLMLEALVGYAIRDNLTLNIMNLLYPTDVVSTWQMQ